MLEARDQYLSAELAQLGQQLEAASSQAAASQQAAIAQLRDLHSWAHASLEALQARCCARVPSCLRLSSTPCVPLVQLVFACSAEQNDTRAGRTIPALPPS